MNKINPPKNPHKEMKAKISIFILLALIACIMGIMLMNRLSGLNGAALITTLCLIVFSWLPKTNAPTGAKNKSNGERN